MVTIVTETTVDPRNGETIPVEWFSASENYTEYGRVLVAPATPGDCPLLLLTLSLN